MKIKLKNTVEQVELIKAMASKDGETSNKAREAFAAFIGPVLQQVLNLTGFANLIYVDYPYNEDDLPSFPLDLYYNANVNQVQVYQQNMAGGEGSSLQTGLQEMLLSTYRLDTAVSLLEKNIRRGRLPYVSLALNRAAQELLIKTERNGWIILMKALGEASTNGVKHTIATTSANVLQVDDFNRLITLNDRLNVAFNGGTPDNNYTGGPTDMFLSPEAMQEIRSWSYQPMNTRAVPNTDESTAVPLPESIRERIFNANGTPEIFNKTLHRMLELGTSRTYNNLFSLYAQAGIAGGGASFSATADELIFCADLTRDAAIKPIAQNAEYGTSLVMQVDDTFSKRSGKVGWWGGIEQGNVVIDAREFSGLIL